MFDPFRIKSRISWPVVRAHLCTFALALSFNSTWRAPRDGYRHGALAYGLVGTVVTVVVALPATLLQLAVGQLSQQDAVGVWRAVPFFKGVGYLRLLTSLLGAVSTVVYVALLVSYFLYTANNSIPFVECMDFVATEDGYENLYNGTTCLNSTFLGPVTEQAEYFTAVALVIIVLWIVFPFLLFNPAKMMKRALYPLGPTIAVLFTVVLVNVGDGQHLGRLVGGWWDLASPGLWFAAVAQALWSTQVAGGYLISAGDTLYASTNVQWSAIAIAVSSILGTWASLVFWAAVGGGARDASGAAVLVTSYQLAEDHQLPAVWPMLLFAALFLSGIVTMLTLLYPLYDRFRRIGGYKWRFICMGSSVVGAAAALAALAGRLPALQLLEDTASPLLVCVATVLEILAFVFIYGKKVLVEDIEFLMGHELHHAWAWGWYSAPVVILPPTVWWVVSELLQPRWVDPPWTATTICATATVAILVFVIFAAVAVFKQVQYDFCAKLKASFKPSRHWGPRDPITHYYWLARRDEVDRGIIHTRYQRRQLGQLSGRSSFLHDGTASISKQLEVIAENKRRSNSDDWLYTIYRKQHIEETFRELYSISTKTRSMSLAWADPGRQGKPRGSSNYFTPLDSLASLGESNNNVVDVKNLVIDSNKNN